MSLIDLSIDESHAGVSRRLDFADMDGTAMASYGEDIDIDILGETKHDDQMDLESKDDGPLMSDEIPWLNRESATWAIDYLSNNSTDPETRETMAGIVRAMTTPEFATVADKERFEQFIVDSFESI